MDSKALEILKEYGYWDYVDIRRIVQQMWIILEEVEIETLWVYWYSCSRYWKRFIIVKANSYPKYKRFVIAHELAHLIYDSWEVNANRGLWTCFDYREKRADNFAMDILIPDKIFQEKIQEIDDVSALSAMFWVPRKLIEKKIQLWNT